jgi:myo-inositol 2-dehydrogenase / D-chiro-inositol 1-dehydrogenase
MTVADAQTKPVGVGLIGAGAIGAFHAETLARRLPGARLVGVADPAPGAAERLAGSLARRRPPPTRPSCWPTRPWRRC